MSRSMATNVTMPDGDSALMRCVQRVSWCMHSLVDLHFERQCVDQDSTGKQEAAARSSDQAVAHVSGNRRKGG
jgi:hypothetical protein